MNDNLNNYSQWLGGKKLDGIKFLHNSRVDIFNGDHKGDSGSVVSISLYPPIKDVIYIVETENHGDVKAREAEISLHQDPSSE